MITNSKNDLTVALFRCIQNTSEAEICRGTLNLCNDKLICSICGYQYKKIHGVPVLKAELLDSSDTWFEQMYANRSRTLELVSDYLRNEREFMEQFVRTNSIQGPCLEIGCGTGLFAEIVPKFIGLEYSLESLLAEGFDSFMRICADARIIPLIDESIECIFSFNVLEHIPDVNLALSEMDRLLKSGGFLVLKPAWHCTRYNTELIPVLPYQQLNFRQKLVKFFLPILTSKPYKFLTRNVESRNKTLHLKT